MSKDDSQDKVRLLDPTGDAIPRISERAKRLESLQGIHLGLLENRKPNSGKILTYIASLLQERYGVASYSLLAKPDASRPSPEDIVNELAARSQAVLTGVGD